MKDFACKKFNLDEVIRCSLGFTKTEFKIMKYMILNSEKEFTTQKISEILKIGLSTSQKAINKINEKGLVKRNQKNFEKGGYVFIYSIKDKVVLEKEILKIIHNWTKKVEVELRGW